MKIAIPSMPRWEQIDGDANPGTYGGTIARSDGDSLELLKIQPVREYAGDAEADEVGYPFWTREGYYDLSDLNPEREAVQSALSFVGVDEETLEDDYTPTQRALLIASALLDYGESDEGPSGWSDDIIHDEVKWMQGQVAGSEYLADEDQDFARAALEYFLIDDWTYFPNDRSPTSAFHVKNDHRGDIEITEWTDVEEATGEEQPEGAKVLREDATVELDELFDPEGKHRGSYSGDDKSVDLVALAKMSQSEREKAVRAAAIAYIGHFGGEEELVASVGD